MRPEGLQVDGVEYTILSQSLYNGTDLVSEPDGKDRFSVGSTNGYICTINLFNPNNAGHNYRVNVSRHYI